MQPSTIPSDLILPYFLSGLALALFGWTIYWTGVHALGIALGGGFGVASAALAANLLEIPDQNALLLMAGGAILGAVAGIFLIRTVHAFVFFILGAMIGAPLAWKVLSMPPLSNEPWAQAGWSGPVAILLGGLLGGALVHFGRKYVIAAATSLVGAVLIGMSLPTENQILIAALALIVSFAFQVGLLRAFIPSETLDRATRRG